MLPLGMWIGSRMKWIRVVDPVLVLVEFRGERQPAVDAPQSFGDRERLFVSGGLRLDVLRQLLADLSGVLLIEFGLLGVEFFLLGCIRQAGTSARPDRFHPLGFRSRNFSGLCPSRG